VKRKPDRKWLAALALLVGAACAAAASASLPGRAAGAFFEPSVNLRAS
jgi:hypothetical protein